MRTSRNKFDSGYTLLFAVLTATLVLGVGVFILSVSKKQYDLSVAARESMYAIYAADSGIECGSAASKQDLIATSTFQGYVNGAAVWAAQDATIKCNGQTASAAFATFNPTAAQNTLWKVTSSPAAPIPVYQSNPMFISFSDGTCALITVFNGYDPNMKPTQRIESRGYNSCDAAAVTPGPKASSRTVERALRLTYK